MNAILVDDEPKARRILRVFIEEYCPAIHLVGEASSVLEAVDLIHAVQPELVFLDVEMPEHSGFALFDFIKNPSFNVIFTTAYSEYALKAFEVSAIDYLLKPIQISQLIIAVKRAIERKSAADAQVSLAVLQSNLAHPRLQRIVLSLAEGQIFVNVSDILFIKADGSYAHFYLADGRTIMVSKVIKDFEHLLTPEEGFFRSHRSFLINTLHIKRIDQDGIHFGIKTHALLARERRPNLERFLT